MKTEKNNIVLVGMPGVGKSTVGVILAKELGYDFIDSDLLIQKREGKLLKEILDERGADGFIALEDEVNSGIEAKRAVIATGGSAVYGKKAMRHFSETAVIVYLKLPYGLLEKRLGDLHNRGVVLKKGQDLRQIYRERTILYEQYADIIVDETGCGIEKTLDKVKEGLKNYHI